MNEDTTGLRVKIIEHATHDDIQTGDRFVWEETWTTHGVTFTNRREGTAHHRNNLGNWETTEGGWLPSADGEGVTLTLRRPVRDLPTRIAAVIVPNDGHEAIGATVGGLVWRTGEAVLGADGLWHGVWRGAGGGGAIPAVDPEKIALGTCKEEGQ